MARDFHAYLEHYNYETHQWESVLLYRKNQSDFQEIPFIEGGWGDAMDILTDRNSSYPELKNTHAIEKETLSPEVNKHYQELFETINGKKMISPGIFNISMINLADIQIYTLKYPSIADPNSSFDELTTPDFLSPKIKNPLSNIMEYAIHYIVSWDDTAFLINSLSDYRMIYWGDC